MTDSPPRQAPTRAPAIAVIGGGIAGAAACVSIARAGLRPLWLAPPPDRTTDPIGESLSPAAGPILEALGLGGLLASPRHRRSNTTFSAWGSSVLAERSAAVHLEGPGRVLDRHAFETDLAEAASARADRVPLAVAHAAADGDGWALTLADGQRRRAAFLIDASGRSALVGRALAAYRRIDRQVAATALLPHRDAEVEPTPATLIEAVADGWWYAALLPDGRLSLAYFSDPDLLPADLTRDLATWRRLIARTRHVGRWVADAGFGVEAPPRLSSAGTTRLDPPAGTLTNGAGWAAVGDAAAAFDPLSSHGMTTALWTGARAGRAAVDALAGRRETLALYADAVARGFDNFLVQRAALCARERRFADAPFWLRRAGACSATLNMKGQRHGDVPMNVEIGSGQRCRDHGQAASAVWSTPVSAVSRCFRSAPCGSDSAGSGYPRRMCGGWPWSAPWRRPR